MPRAATRLSRCAFAGALVAVIAVSSEGREEPEDKSKFLTRSVYVPVQFELCEHLRDGVLFMGERPIARLPSKRIFQFTYYPQLARVEPLRTDVRVEGLREDGSDFVGRMAVTPLGIYTASSRVELDLDAQLRKLRHKLDIRYQTLVLRLRCHDDCARRDDPARSNGVALHSDGN